MARDRRDIANREGAAQAAAVPSASPGPAVSAPVASPADKALAGNRGLSEDRDLFRHFLRALARDAARRDDIADPD